MNQYLPIKKVVAAFVAAGLAYVARRAGVDLGDAEINEAAVALVGIAAAYLVRDPRVKPADAPRT